MLMITLL